MPNIILQTERLTKRYGSLTAVKDLTLDVYEGEVFGFLGPNGAGKTTSINMICGLLKPDSGQVLIHGQPINNHDANLPGLDFFRGDDNLACFGISRLQRQFEHPRRCPRRLGQASRQHGA